MASEQQKTYVLTGSPNSGKSTLFNRLTGLRQKVGNYPGVTVEQISGRLAKNNEITLIDLPGCYSLYPTSMDERVVLEQLVLREERPDAVVHVIHGLHIERSMLLLSQIIDLGYPVIGVISMSDSIQDNGLTVDVDALQRQLDIPLISISARTGEGIEELKEAITAGSFSTGRPIIPDDTHLVEPFLGIKKALGLNDAYSAKLLACQKDHIEKIKETVDAELSEDFKAIRVEVEDKQARLAKDC